MINQEKIDSIRESDRLSPGQKDILIQDEKDHAGGRSKSAGNLDSPSTTSLDGEAVEDYESTSGTIQIRNDGGRFFCVRYPNSEHPHVDGKSFDSFEDAEKRVHEMIQAEREAVEESTKRWMGEVEF